MSKVSISLVTAGVLGIASAATGEISDPVFSITATNANGTGTTTFGVDEGQWDGDTFSFELNDAYEIWNEAGTALLAEVKSISTTVIEDPVVEINFNVVAANMETAFMVDSTLLSFPALNAPTGKATAGITITDQNGDGASLTGDLGDGNAYRAVVNGSPGVGDDVATLVGDFSAGSFSSNTSNGAFDDGNGGFVALSGPISSISAQFQFTVSPFDAASGTSVFTVVPAPASVSLIGVGLLAATRRRR